MPHRHDVPILMADDDPLDRMLTNDAFLESGCPRPLQFVVDGQDLLDYLEQTGRYSAPGAAPRPGLILLDLNMPKIGGLEALRRIRANPALRSIPIVVLTTSSSPEDVDEAYALGANSFLIKPASYDALVHMAKMLEQYWMDLVRLPPHLQPAGV